MTNQICISSELGEDRRDLRIVGGPGPRPCQVARCARQREVVKRRRTAVCDALDVVDVEGSTFGVEEAQHTAGGHLGAQGAEPAVMADSAVALGDGVADGGWNVGVLSHARSLGFGSDIAFAEGLEPPRPLVVAVDAAPQGA